MRVNEFSLDDYALSEGPCKYGLPRISASCRSYCAESCRNPRERVQSELGSRIALCQTNKPTCDRMTQAAVAIERHSAKLPELVRK